MSEFDLDAELINLLNAERAKEQFRVESLEAERKQVCELFYEHVVAVSSLLDGDYSVEEIPINVTDREEQEEELCAQLNELMQSDIERYEKLTTGEIQVIGEGVYVLDCDDERFPCELLNQGETIRGTIEAYGVAQLLTVDKPEDEYQGSVDLPSIWVTLSDARVFGVDGKELSHNEYMLVPFTLPGLQFGKIVRLSDDLAPQPPHDTVSSNDLFHDPSKNSEDLTELKSPDIREQLSGSMFQELSNDIENDLNYNNYDDPEVLQETRREYQQALYQHVADIDVNEPINLTAANTELPMGGTIDLIAQNVFYNGPTILKFSNGWRVVHGFSVIDDEGKAEQLVHVLPETIKLAFRAL